MPDTTKPRILLLGDAAVPTGFARVMYNIFAPLCNEFELHQLGVNYQGWQHDWPWKLYIAQEKDNRFGFNKLEELLNEVNPSLIFMLSVDVVLAAWMRRIVRWKGRSDARVIIYCPVDAGPLKHGVVNDLLCADRLFTYTEFGRQCFQQSITQQPTTNPLPVEIMPHGIDSAVFQPLQNDIHYHLSPEGRLQAKRSLVGEQDSQLDDSFIVLNANRNEERKRLDTTIRGFARFAAGKPSTVRLYLHCGVKDLGWNVLELARQEGIMERLIFSSTQGLKPSFPNSEMNKIFNACETGINTSSAEGWGLVNFEHAAAGAAQLVPDHTGCGELWRDYAMMLQPSASIINTEDLKEHFIISPHTVAASLEQLYQDEDYHHAMCTAAYKNATRPEYEWTNIARRWCNIILSELALVLPAPVNASRTSASFYSQDLP